MNARDIIGYVATGLVALSAIVQISPIKLNPWSWILRRIGKAVNEEMLNRLTALESDFVRVKQELDEHAAKADRARILRFGDDLLYHANIKHSKEHFDDILRCIDDYMQYCEAHPDFKNGVTEQTTKYILQVYEHCMEEHSFL